MQVRKVLALRGPNVWADFPVLEAWVELGEYNVGSDKLPGFNERLMALLPSMIEHRCSEGVRGGFFERLRRGTWPGHILEHITLELQCLAGTEIGFGRARETSTPGLYKVVVEYHNEDLARASLEAGLRLWWAAVRNEPFDVEGEVEKLRSLWKRVAPSPATTAIVRAARNRRIPVRFLSGEGLIQLGHGDKQHRLQGSQTDRTSATAESIARDNHLTRSLLQAVGVPVLAAETVQSADAAWEAAEDLGLPVSVRPRYGKERRPDWERLETREQVVAAYQTASDNGDDPVLVERVGPGILHRLLVVGGRVVAATRHEGEPGASATGVADVTAEVHSEVAARAVEAARVIGLDVAAVEVMVGEVGRPLEEQGGAAVRAVRAQPDLAEFLRPNTDEVQPVAQALVASLFPDGDNGRIPVVSITGTNGKTTTTRLTAHLLGRVYKPVGMANSEGIYVGDRLIEAGDCSGPKSARAVLQHPEVQAAALETARGGIVREGLGFDRCHVAVVTNVAKGDHLGLGDVHTPEQVAAVKRTPLDVLLPDGAAVLNANDPLVAAMGEDCRGAVIFFARDGQHPVILGHRAEGKRAAFVRDNTIILAEGDRETPLVTLDRVPLTHGGRVGFHVENALGATAAAWSLGIPLAEIRAGLETFVPAIDQTVCRFNLLEYRGATLLLDYAHNISALESLLEVVRTFPHARRSVVYAVPGDRSDEVITSQGELLGAAYDRVILYEDTELRGRPDGAIFALMRQGLARHSRTREVVEVRGNLKAIELALATVKPGELLHIQPEFPDVAAVYFARLVEAGAREVTLDRVWANARSRAVDVR